MKSEREKCHGELLRGDATQKHVDPETATYDVLEDLRSNLKYAIMGLTEKECANILMDIKQQGGN